MVFLLLDPLYILWAIIGYVVMFILAAFIAPKVANRFSGKFSLFTSMVILASVVIGVFSLVLAAIISISSQAFGSSTPISSLIFYITFLVIISNLLIYIFSPLLINLMHGCEKDQKIQRIVDDVKNKLKYKGKLNAVVTRRFGLPNAFAYGNFIFGKYVAVTPGMINLTNENELKAVIGHEIGHHIHRDNAIMLLFGLLPALLYYLGYFLFRAGLFSRGSRREGGSSAILAILGIVAMLASFIVQILVLAFSRLREYYADTVGAKSAGKINMQSSLAKIHYYYKGDVESIQKLKDSSFKTLFIYAFTNSLANPFREIEIEKVKKEKYSAIEEFLSSHPPIPKRLIFLDKLK
ncbi:MAG: M48 family metalloprotease [Candidatus Aenigmatarchaeota archaeon]